MNHHPSPVAASSQCGKILKLLRRFRYAWIDMPWLSRFSGCYAIHSRIADLRRLGFNIENKVERGERSQCKSWYRLRKQNT